MANERTPEYIMKENNVDPETAAAVKALWKELDLSAETDIFNDGKAKPISPPPHPMLLLGVGAAVLVNVGFLMSLPPVLRGRGAPYLPTFQKNMNAMFTQLRRESTQSDSATNFGKFVDLGSGDGRVVFRAARENMFELCVGYEINPLLHGWACVRRILSGPAVWRTTRLARADLWHVNLRDTNVVAVYGLGPIMKDLGLKLQNELQPGSYVLSNVFPIPNWTPERNTTDGTTFLYKTPECWQKHEGKRLS